MLFAAVLAGLGLLIASITPRRGFGVAAIIVVLVVSGLVAATLQGVTYDTGHHTLAGYFGALGPFTLVDGVQVWAFGADPSSRAGPPGTVGGLVFLALMVGVVAGCFGLLLARYRKVSAS